jgi:hypothetical protein
MSFKKCVVTICYNNATVLKESIEQYYNLCKNSPDLHVFLDNNYPIEKEKTSQTIRDLATKFGGTYLNYNTNLGMRDGLRKIYSDLEFKDEDRIIIYDSNAFVTTKDFDDYLFKALDNSNVAFSAATFPIQKAGFITETDFEYEFDPIHNMRYYKNREQLQVIKGVFSTVGAHPFKMHKYINADFDMFTPLFAEVANTHNRVKKIISDLGMTAMYLTDVKEEFVLLQKEDELYKRYKVFITSLKPFNSVSFEEFIEKNHLIQTEKYVNPEVAGVNKSIQYLNNIFT